MRSFGFLIHASLNSALATYTLGATSRIWSCSPAPSPDYPAAIPYLPLEASPSRLATNSRICRIVARTARRSAMASAVHRPCR